MSAEILSRAASLMRERAEAARPQRGHWVVQQFMPEDRDYEHQSQVMTDPKSKHYGFVASSVFIDDAEHIASWHPAVTLAVAKAMEDVALAWDISDGWVLDLDDDSIRFEETIDSGWLAVARTYLGESA